jgi:hypothetical protein
MDEILVIQIEGRNYDITMSQLRWFFSLINTDCECDTCLLVRKIKLESLERMIVEKKRQIAKLAEDMEKQDELIKTYSDKIIAKDIE